MEKGSAMNDIRVEGKVVDLTIEMEASYPEHALVEAGFDEPFRKLILEEYDKWADGCRDCILSIRAQVAGSQVVKGIFELYRAVRARSGILVCANYPADYVRALTDLGLPALPGFVLCSSLSEARERIKTLRSAKEVKRT